MHMHVLVHVYMDMDMCIEYMYTSFVLSQFCFYRVLHLFICMAICKILFIYKSIALKMCMYVCIGYVYIPEWCVCVYVCGMHQNIKEFFCIQQQNEHASKTTLTFAATDNCPSSQLVNARAQFDLCMYVCMCVNVYLYMCNMYEFFYVHLSIAVLIDCYYLSKNALNSILQTFQLVSIIILKFVNCSLNIHQYLRSFPTEVSSLAELAARCVASYIPFELVEHVYPPVPEQLQLRIAFWSFPDNEEDIRLYSCLANSSADEFNRGDQLFRLRAVKDPLQIGKFLNCNKFKYILTCYASIGFHLSASVSQAPRTYFNVAVTFDRRRISSCNCTCTSSAYWCSHVVAVCLHRIHCVCLNGIKLFCTSLLRHIFLSPSTLIAPGSLPACTCF